jgi:RHS repeat-associated protein
VYHQESHISYYGADNKLRVFNRHIGIWITSADSLYGERGTFDEYRYDALGRRVLTRTRRIGGGCPGTLDCQSRATRTVWDGDRILYEIRSPGGEIISGGPPPPPPPPDTITHGPRALETEFLSARADTVPDPAIEAEVTVIGYTHAIGVSGIDEPIELHAAQSIFPHTGWRGMLAMGTYANGAESDCPVVNPCDRIDWPGSNVTIDRRGYGRDEPTNWYGTLASSQGEGSGLQYMRNRYYDPTRGQFTQADPIGLGGGLNLYGFAGGDPITYSDPFGLCPPCGANPLEPRHYQPGVLGTLLIGVVEGAKQFWAKHRDDVLYVGLVLLSEGRAVGEEASPLLGRNPRLGTGNPPAVNTDLPGGRPVAKSIFRNQTKGTTIKQAPLENGGVRRFAPDGTQIRMNPNGSTRLDLPRGPTGREKIHFDPE